MLNKDTKWYATATGKYISKGFTLDEAEAKVKADMGKLGSKGGSTPSDERNGFDKNHDRAVAAGKKGLAKRYGKKYE